MTGPASYSEWRRSRGCGEKRRYSSQFVAANVALILRWKGSPGNAPYECEFCGFWHVGHGQDGGQGDE